MYKGHYQPQILSARLKHNKNKVRALISMISKEKKAYHWAICFNICATLVLLKTAWKTNGEIFFSYLFAFKILTFSPLVAKIYNTDESSFEMTALWNQ